MLESRQASDEDKLLILEQALRDTSEVAIDSEKKCDEVYPCDVV